MCINMSCSDGHNLQAIIALKLCAMPLTSHLLPHVIQLLTTDLATPPTEQRMRAITNGMQQKEICIT